MTTIKHQPEYNEAIDAADRDIHALTSEDLRCPYLWTSNMADAYWITAYHLYHSGKRPLALHKSKGHTWLVDTGVIRRVTVEEPNHRTGIREEYLAA